MGLIGLTGMAQSFDLQGHRGARGLMPENTLGKGRTTGYADRTLSAPGIAICCWLYRLARDELRASQNQC